MGTRRWLVAAGTALAIGGAVSAQTLETLSWLTALDKPQLDPASAVTVEGLTIHIGPAELKLDSGVLVPTLPIAGNREEAVFVGSGRLIYEPPDLIERGQLDLFSGRVRLNEPFEQLVVGGAGLRLEELIGPGARLAPSVPPDAEKTFAAWRDGAGRISPFTSERLLMARLDPEQGGSFSFAAVEVKELGNLRLALEPDRGDTPFTLSHYEPIELSDWEKRNARYQLRDQLRSGRFAEIDLDHVAVWDLWSAAKFESLVNTGPSFRGRGYSIDVTLDPGGERLSGTCAIQTGTQRTQARAFRLELHDDLKLTALHDSNGVAIPFRQRRGSVWGFLPAAAQPGSLLVITAEFSGTLFEKTERRQYRTWNTLGWHPHLLQEYPERMLHELTVRWSLPLDVRLSGKKIDGGSNGTQNWVKHASVVPASGMFLEVGRFEDLSATRGEREVSIAFSAHNKTWMKPEGRKRVVDEVHNILDWMEQQLGPAQVKALSLIIVEQGFGQSLPGTVILPDSSLRQSTFALKFGASDWRLLLAHEIAHQWWGCSVTPASDADRWLSEAAAEYMAQMYGKLHLEKELGEAYVPPTKWWRSQLEHRFVVGGRPVESVGPIELGTRLSSSLCPSCYSDIVYTKGALALQVLGQYLGEGTFLKMLREITTRFTGKKIDSSTFLALITKMSATDLSWFRQRYLAGTGLPIVFYSYQVTPAPSGGWDVAIDVEQQSEILISTRLAKGEDQRFKVINSRLSRVQDPSAAPLPFPIVLTVVNPKEPPKVLGPRQVRTWRDEANWRLSTRAILQGDRGTVHVHSDFKVVEVKLDPENSTFADFNCSTCYPKSTFRAKAARAIFAEQLEDAERFLEQARQAEVDGFGEPKDMGQRALRRHETLVEDAGIDFLKARIALLRGDVSGAQLLVREGEARGDIDETWADYERARVKAAIALSQGDYKRAYQLLWKEISGSEYVSTTSLLQMAIAAHHTGEVDAYNKAMRRAKKRFADVSLLEEVQPVPDEEDPDKDDD